MGNKTEKHSEKLSDIVRYFDSIKSEYESNLQNIAVKDAEHQDFIHSLELDDLKYKERAKIATQIQQSRKDRRISKDIVDVLEPLYSFIESDSGKRSMNQLKNILGNMRKREEKQLTRVYHKRIAVARDDDKSQIDN